MFFIQSSCHKCVFRRFSWSSESSGDNFVKIKMNMTNEITFWILLMLRLWKCKEALHVLSRSPDPYTWSGKTELKSHWLPLAIYAEKLKACGNLKVQHFHTCRSIHFHWLMQNHRFDSKKTTRRLLFKVDAVCRCIIPQPWRTFRGRGRALSNFEGFKVEEMIEWDALRYDCMF